MSKITLLFLFFFIPQNFVATEDFSSKIKRGITVIEFWAEWNKKNEVKYLGDLSGCKKYRLNIIEHSGIQKKYNIYSIPTLIIFKNGKLQERYSPNIMMQLEVSQEEVQTKIDNLNRN